MKNFTKILLITFLTLFFSCSKDESIKEIEQLYNNKISYLGYENGQELNQDDIDYLLTKHNISNEMFENSAKLFETRKAYNIVFRTVQFDMQDNVYQVDNGTWYKNWNYETNLPYNYFYSLTVENPDEYLIWHYGAKILRVIPLNFISNNYESYVNGWNNSSATVYYEDYSKHFYYDDYLTFRVISIE